MKDICRSTYDIIEEAYELQRRKATELLAFVISDTDRIHSAEHPNQIPIAYALKGYSLSTGALHKMVNVVWNKCNEHGIDALYEATDGQWAHNCTRAEDGSPLTRIQFQKDVWNKFVRNSKSTLYNILLSYSKVDKRCLEELSGLTFPREMTFEMGNLQTVQRYEENGQKHFNASSVGSDDRKIPMIQHIKTTSAKSAWITKSTKGKVLKDIISTDTDDVIDVLSLIPPELLQNRDIGIDNDQNLDVPNGNTDQTTSNGTNDADPKLDDQNTSHTAEYNTDDTNNMEAMSHGNLEQNDVNILQAILEKLIEGSSANKWKKRNLTPGKLY